MNARTLDTLYGPSRDRLDDAERLARLAHAGQVDKQGKPYVEHLERVAARMKYHLRVHVVVAWLHDILEDTVISPALLAEYFEPQVVEAVIAITHGRNEPRIEYYERVKANPIALAVKLADIADNCDPRRLLGLPIETMTRLMRKYADALDALEG